MTTVPDEEVARRRAAKWTIVDAEAPPERLAAFRVVVGVFTLAYLVVRWPVFAQLAERTAGFEGVGVFAFADRPLPDHAVAVLLVVAVLSGVGFATGGWFRVTGPVFALTMLTLTSYRSSWGQLLHFENLIVLFVAIVAVSPAADAWSLDARRRRTPRLRPATAYGWPLRLACLTVVVTYVIAGFAKLRYGGVEWVLGDTLRNHIAYSAVRLDLLGATPSPLARLAVDHAWVLPPMALASVAVELAAPVALLGGRLRTAWVVAAWLMHAAIFALMLVGFPAPLFLVAFAPFYDLEVVAERGRTLLPARRRQPSRVVG